MIRFDLRAVSLAAVAVLATFVVESHAQSPRGIGGYSGRYQPSRPTISPYLNLYRTQRGPIPNYHLYVRPILQQQQINAQQSAAVNQLQQGLQETQHTQHGPTGIGAGYRNFSHYYSGLR
jgi:hypothetical protein